MAQKVIERLIDDLDGSTATTTVAYTWEGVQYEIDLNKKNAAQFNDAIKPFLTASRKLTAAASIRKSPARRARAANPAPKADVVSIRDWAKTNGVNVADRGRIPASVVQAFQTSQQPDRKVADQEASQTGKSATAKAATTTARVTKIAQRTTTTKAATAEPSVKADLSAVRQWADSTGIAISPRGRIADSVMAAYRATQPATTPAVQPELGAAAKKPSSNGAARKASIKPIRPIAVIDAPDISTISIAEDARPAVDLTPQFSVPVNAS